ncbi:MAG: DUF424 family protein [Candidatus Bathyarchaeota archaeon]|nr:MAG: DUF424 family protein [Candidatus Bathyarchaeota archaeon]
MEVYVNLQRRGRYTLLATCDVNLLGKTFRDERLVFEIRKEFYMGSRMSVDEAIMLMKQSAIVNMVGRNIVAKALENGLIHPDAILEISGIPHAQIVRL